MSARGTSGANALRGEAELRVDGAVLVLRPSFAALVAAEAELGPLFALVERAADGRLGLGELAALFWHCVEGRPEALTRAAVGEAVNVTTKDSGGWRELLSGAGVRSVSVSAAGIFTGSAAEAVSYTHLRAHET